MAKDKKTDYSKLTLGSKIPLSKADVVAQSPVATPAPEKTEKVEKAVNAIHGEKTTSQKIVKPMKTEERTLRVTLDIPLSLHAQIKTKTFQSGISMKEFFLELAKKDMA